MPDQLTFLEHVVALEQKLRPLVENAIRPLVALGISAPRYDGYLEDVGNMLAVLGENDPARAHYEAYRRQRAGGRVHVEPPAPSQLAVIVPFQAALATSALTSIWITSFMNRIGQAFQDSDFWGDAAVQQVYDGYRLEGNPYFYRDSSRVGDDMLPSDLTATELEWRLWCHVLDPDSARSVLRNLRATLPSGRHLDQNLQAILDAHCRARRRSLD